MIVESYPLGMMTEPPVRAALGSGGHMADDKSKKGPADASRINVHEDYEVEYWSKKFGCSKIKLAEAVTAVGVMAKDVEAWLKTH